MHNTDIEELLRRNERKYGKYAHYAMIVGGACIFLAPFILTFPAIWEHLDFSGTGPIGDTIGGITSPFMNLIGALLVYYSFKQQMLANRLQMSAIEQEYKDRAERDKVSYCESIYEEIKLDLENISIDGTQNGGHLVGHFFGDLVNIQVTNGKKKNFDAKSISNLNLLNSMLNESLLLFDWIEKIKTPSYKQMIFDRYYLKVYRSLFTSNGFKKFEKIHLKMII